MLVSIGLILFLGVVIDQICKKSKIPSLVGFIILGIILGPSGFNLLDSTILAISADIRQIILIIILTRAGLSLNLKDLKKVGRPAVLLSFLPATFEIIGTMIFAPIFLGISILEAALLGAILGAVSPAVVVPRMITLIQEKYGTQKRIPQLLLAGSSVDDIYGLVLFYSFLALLQSGQFHVLSLLDIPVSIVSGIVVGVLSGYVLATVFKRSNLIPIIQVLIMLSISLGLVSIEAIFINLPFSGILAVMSMAIILFRQLPLESNNIAKIYNKLWIPGEMFLFTLVGASVNVSFAFSEGWLPILVVLLALIIRMLGVYVSLMGTQLSAKEQLFCLIAYSPKATVQAAIGSIPLELGLTSGELILTVSVLAILITAPFGAFGMDLSYKYLLSKEE
jgi:NhaP-type Na+/H+ or K+/H+ antiporter